MKDFTSTSIGYVIGFLLPGLVALFGLSFWFPKLDQLLTPERLTNTAIGPSFFILLAALTLGLVLSSFRCLLFEVWLFEGCGRFKKYEFAENLFSTLVEQDKFSVFKAIVDEHYRYHQFYGGLFIADFLVGIGLLCENVSKVSCWIVVLASIGFGCFQFHMFKSALDALKKYRERANSLVEHPTAKEQQSGVEPPKG